MVHIMLNIRYHSLIIISSLVSCLLGMGLVANAQAGLRKDLQAQSGSNDTLNPPGITSPSTGPTNPRPTGPTDPGPGLPGPTNPSPGIINDVYPPDPKSPHNPNHVDSPVRESVPKGTNPGNPAQDKDPAPSNSPQ